MTMILSSVHSMGMRLSLKDQYKIPITIANYTVLLRTDHEPLATRLNARYADFLDDTGSPVEATIDLHLVTNGEYFVPPTPGPWVIESTYTNEHLTYRSYLEKGEVDWTTKQGHLHLHANAHVENFLRVVYAWLSFVNGGILLHSAGVIHNEHGYALFGPSGAGKSTTARLSADSSEILSDDLVIIRIDNGHSQIYGVPFKGDFSDAPRANQNAPLRAIFRLRQGDVHAIEPLAKITGIAELAASAPFIARERHLSQQLLTVCTKIAQMTPMYQLHFKRDSGFWQVIDEHF